MHEAYELFFKPYEQYSTLNIVLEALAVVFGIFSVVYSKKNNVLVYPTGLAGTVLYIYLAWQWQLYGDMIINGYYFYMSVYGWYVWSRKDGSQQDLVKITTVQGTDKIWCLSIFAISVMGVSLVYIYFNKFTHWWAGIDTIVTGLLFVGMWLMARRKLENWLFLITGNVIAIPLFFLKGYVLTSILYVVLTIIAIFGYKAWKRIVQKQNQLQ
ncbi:nicotinamide riboside transporter PnuC [uncultured Flavobacterium sp.]|uniref:nicotinamide riboside transporter PnuC n=1 Tax=uncultured Flavobacterium sp. TaxID=165435 RepID=UPI0025DA5B08|nr:nicotinamide riboside transporter PnuC [uncultured Flavobacterium sp.]